MPAAEPTRQTERPVTSDAGPEGIQARVDELMGQMTPAEKAGQLTQYFYFRLPAGAAAEPALGLDVEAQPRMVEEALGRGEVGSLLFVTDPAEINRLQRLALTAIVSGSRCCSASTSYTDCARCDDTRMAPT